MQRPPVTIGESGVVPSTVRTCRVVGLRSGTVSFEHSLVKAQLVDCTDSVIEFKGGVIAQIEVLRCARCRLACAKPCAIFVEESTMVVLEARGESPGKIFSSKSPGLSVHLDEEGDADFGVIEAYGIPETQTLAVTTFFDDVGFRTARSNAYGDAVSEQEEDPAEAASSSEEGWRVYNPTDEESLERKLWNVTKKRRPNNGPGLKQLLPCELLSDLMLSDLAGVRDAQRLKALGVTHVLNLAANETTFREGRYERCGIAHLDVAAADDPGYDIMQHLPEAAAFYADASASRGKLVVHCVAGINRSGAIATALYVQQTGTGLLEAAAHINRLRGPYLWNATFRHLLAEWSSSLDVGKSGRQAGRQATT
mmetsp:Transcript_4181/g.13752  ORF Transcript_4181/g.13752 Transcript_4181/m.13752 type:complete len:367 (-) Transcript_4181:29-1129(-)